MNLQLDTRREADGIAVVSVGGEVDNDTAPQLKDALSAAFADGAGRVIVDLSGTEFMDSSGLGALVGINKEHGNGRLALVCPRPQLRKLFEISRLDEVLAVHDDLPTALDAG